MTMGDIRRMTLGTVVDFVIDFNSRNKSAEEENKRPKRRRATQADINAFFG